MNPQSIQQHHVPLTTGGSGLNAIKEAFLGPNIGSNPVSVYDRVARPNYDLPENYRDRALFIKTTINGFILEDNEWYTTYCLPWVYSEQLHVRFNEWHFNTVLADRVPHEGVSRLVTSSKSEFQGHVVRRGLAFTLEADFYNTPQGEVQLARNTRGIAQCVQETQNHDTIYALLECKDYAKIWQENFGRLDDPQKIYEYEIINYAGLCKSENALELLYEQHKRLMAKRNVRPDLMIMSPGTKIYIKQANPEKTAYYSMGPNGEQVKLNGPSSIHTFDGVAFFETRDFDVYHDAPPVQLLTRATTIGERYEMLFKDFKGMDLSKYSTRWRDTYLYNENKDDFEKVPFRKAFLHCGLFDNEGNPSERVKSIIKTLQQSNYAAKHKGALSGTSEIYEDGGDYGHKDKHQIPPFFMSTYDNKGDIKFAEYIGQIQRYAIAQSDMKQVGETVIAKMFGSRSKDNEAYNDLIYLIEQIENEPYDRNYWVELIQENIMYSVDARQQFVGENTPDDLVKSHRVPFAIQEWKPNSHGGLNLPKSKNFRSKFPAGFGNWVGILTLADESNDSGSRWFEAGKRAQRGVELVNRLVNAIRIAFPDSAVVDEANRQPWFHRPDANTTFFENVISMPRDPIWLAALPPIDATGGSSSGKVSDSVDNASVPLFSVDGKGATIGGGGGGKNDVKDIDHKGTKVRIPAAMMQMSGVLPMRYVAYAIMHTTRSGPAFQSIEGALSSDKVRAMFFETVIQLATMHGAETARKFVIALAPVVDKEEQLKKIYLPEGAQRTVKSASSKALTALLEQHLPGFDEPNNPVVSASDVLLPALDFSKVSGQPNYAAVRISMLKLMDAASKENTTNGTSYVLDVAKPDDFTGKFATPSADLANAVKEYKTALAAAGIKSDVARKLVPPASHKGYTVVSDTEEMVAGANFKRAPLTMSFALLESVYREALPLIRASDPRNAHLTPYSGGGDQIPGEIWKRPQYAHVDSVIKNPDAKDLEFTTPVSKNIVYIEGGLDEQSSGKKRKAPVVAGPTTKKKKKSLLDSESEEEPMSDMSDFDDDDEAKEKRRRDKDDPIWDKERLQKKGKRGDLDKRKPFLDPTHTKEYHEIYNAVFTHRFKEANRISDSLVRAATIAFLFCRNNGRLWLRMIDNDIHVPINIILWRLRIEHEMSTFILMKSGLETGGNIYGHSNFAFGSDVSTKMLYGNFTFTSKAMVWKEENVTLIENIKPEGYLGGNNCDFVKNPKDLDLRNKNRPSIIATAIPITEESFPLAMSFTGFMPFADYNESMEGRVKCHYSSYQFYESVYKFGDKLKNKQFGRDRFFDLQDRPNVIAFQGLQANYNVSSGLYDKWIHCKGHRGMNGSGVGCAIVWNGKDKFFEKQDFSRYRLE